MATYNPEKRAPRHRSQRANSEAVDSLLGLEDTVPGEIATELAASGRKVTTPITPEDTPARPGCALAGLRWMWPAAYATQPWWRR